jgi:predicted DNA-binding protein (MmcQ/YjbR family)
LDANILAMNRCRATEICAAFPGATLDHPYGPRIEAWKVGGRIFALLSPEDGGVCLKCNTPETADFLIDIGAARPSPHIRRGDWVELSWSCLDDDILDAGDLKKRLRGSYERVIEGLPRRLRHASQGKVGQEGAACRS